MTGAVRVVGRLKIPSGGRPQVLRDGLCAHYNSYKKPQQQLATSIILILELFFRLISSSHFIWLRTLLSTKPFIDRVREAKVHSIFLTLMDQILFSIRKLLRAISDQNKSGSLSDKDPAIVPCKREENDSD